MNRRLLERLVAGLPCLCALGALLRARQLESQGDHRPAEAIVLVLQIVIATAMLCVLAWGIRENVRSGRYRHRCFYFGHSLRGRPRQCPECGKVLRKRQ
jgi:hypothetical protein